MREKKYRLRCRLAAVFLGLLSFSVQADWQQPELSHNLTPVTNDTAAHDFNLQNMDEEDIRLSDYRGKVILINFWATCVRRVYERCRRWSA